LNKLAAMPNKKMIPEKIAHLMVAYFSRTASFSEKSALDKWICASDENMRVFETSLELSLRPISPDPDHSEEESELFQIARLVHKQKLQTLTVEDKECLNDWLESSSLHQQLMTEVPRSKNLELIYRWLVRELIGELK